MEVKERIQQYLDYKGVNNANLEKEVGLSNGYWRKTKSVSANAVADILRVYSDLSAEWVFRGTGSMLLQESDDLNARLDAAIEESRNMLVMTREELRDFVDERIHAALDGEFRKEA